MPTFQVTCSNCNEEKWPTLPERPTTYVCVLCMSVPREVREARKAAAAKGQEKRGLKTRLATPEGAA